MNRLILSICLSLIMFASCTEVVELPDTETYFTKVYNQYIGNFSNGALARDGNIITTMNSYADSTGNLVVSKIDKYGHVIWERKFQVNHQFYAQPGMAIIPFGSNDFLISNRIDDEVIRISEDGEVKYQKHFRKNWTPYQSIYYDAPFLLENGNFLITISDESKLSRYIYELDEFAEIVQITEVPYMYPATGSYEVVAFNNDTILMSTSQSFPNIHSGARKRGLIQIVRNENGGIELVKTSDYVTLTDTALSVNDNPMYRYGTSGHVAQNDEHMYIIGQPQQYNNQDDRFNTLPNTFRLYKCDFNMQLEWVKTFDFGTLVTTCNNTIIADDGGVYLVGRTYSTNYEHSGFLIKVRPDGEIEYNKNIELGSPRGFSSVIEAPDRLVVLGWSGGFGSTLESGLNKPIIIQLPRN